MEREPQQLTHEPLGERLAVSTALRMGERPNRPNEAAGQRDERQHLDIYVRLGQIGRGEAPDRASKFSPERVRGRIGVC